MEREQGAADVAQAMSTKRLLAGLATAGLCLPPISATPVCPCLCCASVTARTTATRDGGLTGGVLCGVCGWQGL